MAHFALAPVRHEPVADARTRRPGFAVLTLATFASFVVLPLE